MNPEIFASIFAGIALAAAAGLRAFLPLLIVNIAARIGWVDLSSEMSFLGGDVALVALAIATVLEISADKIPFVDHLLDLSATVLRPLAGVLAGMSMVSDLPQPVAIALALFLGTISLSTQLARAKVRVGSSVTTGGIANPVISTIEDGVSASVSFLAVLAPILAGILVLVLLFLLFRFVRKVHRAAGRAFKRHPPTES